MLAEEHTSPGVRRQSRRPKVIFRFLRKFSCRFVDFFLFQCLFLWLRLSASFVCEKRHETDDVFLSVYCIFQFADLKCETICDRILLQVSSSVYTSLVLSRRGELWRNIKTAPVRLWIDMPALLLFPVETKAQQFFISTARVSISKEEFLHLLSHIASSEKHFDANAATLDFAKEWKCDGRKFLGFTIEKMQCDVRSQWWERG